MNVNPRLPSVNDVVGNAARAGNNDWVLEIVLVSPQIPPNTGNIIRLCANTGARLHLVQPLGFDLSDRKLRRAGLDYHDLANVTEHASWQELRESLTGGSWYALTSRGNQTYSDMSFKSGDVLVFGTERTGLSDVVLSEFDDRAQLRLPMVCDSRSLNLSNAVSIVVYEAWRQLGFPGAAG